jgi:hypothetical protein
VQPDAPRESVRSKAVASDVLKAFLNAQDLQHRHERERGKDRADMLSKEYQNTAHVLRRLAQNMADQGMADRLEALANDYERRAEKPSRSDKALALSAVRVERERIMQE